jgi:hypothetical protein
MAPTGKKLNAEVFQVIKEGWPIHPSGVCRKLKIEVNSSNISKIKYHFGLLHKAGKIHTKKIDRALVAWPSEIEKIRMIHEFIRDMD